MHLKESHRKYILIGLVTFIVIGIIVAKMMAKSQDEQFLKNELIYQQVQQLYIEGEYDNASILISELLQTQPNSEIVNYIGGLIAATNKEFKNAAILMQKTIDINPHRVEDPVFMLQLGEIFYKAERYKDAKLVLTRCQEAGWVPEEYPNYQEKVAELLKTIENLE